MRLVFVLLFSICFPASVGTCIPILEGWFEAVELVKLHGKKVKMPPFLCLHEETLHRMRRDGDRLRSGGSE